MQKLVQFSRGSFNFLESTLQTSTINSAKFSLKMCSIQYEILVNATLSNIKKIHLKKIFHLD